MPEEVRQRCLARMVNWWKLAQCVLESDFPQYDLLHSFAVFDLSTDMAAVGITEQDCDALATWADRLDLNLAALKEQFLQLRGVASGFRKSSSDTLEAWQKAVSETQCTEIRRRTYPIAALLPLLRRFAAYIASTCGVEQYFSKFKRVLGECRGFSPQSEERIAVLSARTSTPTEDILLAKHARLIWAESFGAPRAKRLSNLPAASALRRQVIGEASAARARRAALELAAGSCDGKADERANAAIRKAGTMWGERQHTELVKRQALAKKRRVDAILHGSCPAGDDDDMADVAKYGHQLQQKRLQLLRKYTADRVTPRTPHEVLPAGTRVFIEPSLMSRGNTDFRDSLSKLRWRSVTDRVLAQVLVVSDPAHPDPKDAFVAALGGRLLVSTDFLKGSGRHGVAIRYERALRLPRYLWVSPACEMKFAAALQVMRQMCQHAGTDEPRTRWKFDTSDEFLARRRGKTGQRELVALVVERELANRDMRRYPGRTTVMAFIKRCTKIDMQGCQAGVLGR